MEQASHEKNRNYNPNRLLDTVMQRLDLKNDAALSKILNVSPATVSKIRHLKLRVGGSMLIRMHEITEYSIKDLRSFMGDDRDSFLENKKTPESQ